MVRHLDSDPVVFITMQAATPVETSRYVLKLANAMYETGIETTVINLGAALPRTSWMLPACVNLEHPHELHFLLDRMRPHIVIGTSPETAFLAHDDSVFTGSHPFYLMSGSEDAIDGDLVQSHLLSTAVRLGEVLAPTKWIAESLENVTFGQVRFLGLAVDTGLRDMGDTQRRNVVFPFDPNSPVRNVADGCRAAVRISGGRLRAVAFGRGEAQPNHVTYTVLSWTDEDSLERSRMYSAGAVFVHATANAGLELDVLDAMACGCPVVAVPSEVSQSICVDGQNCIFTADGGSQAIADAVLRVTRDSDLAARLAEGGRNTVADMTWQRVLDNLPEVIRKQQRSDRAIGLGAIDWHRRPTAQQLGLQTG